MPPLQVPTPTILSPCPQGRETPPTLGTTLPWDIQKQQDDVYPLPLRPNQAVWVEEGSSITGKGDLNSPHSSCWGTHFKIKMNICYKCVVDLLPTSACSLVDGPSSVSSHVPRRVGSVLSSSDVLDPANCSILCSTFPQNSLGISCCLAVGLRFASICW